MIPTFYPSGPIEIRDGTVARIAALGLFKTVLKARIAPTQDEQLPLACVCNAGERTQVDGDANAASPSFFHNLTLNIDLMVSAATEATLDSDVVVMVETVRRALLTDSSWVRLFEGIERFDTRYAYPKEAGSILVQAIMEIEVSYRSIWEPVVPNDFLEMGVYAEPTRSVTCGYCGTVNQVPSAIPDTGAPANCSTCHLALPKPNEPLLTIIDVRADP